MIIKNNRLLELHESIRKITEQMVGENTDSEKYGELSEELLRLQEQVRMEKERIVE